MAEKGRQQKGSKSREPMCNYIVPWHRMHLTLKTWYLFPQKAMDYNGMVKRMFFHIFSVNHRILTTVYTVSCLLCCTFPWYHTYPSNLCCSFFFFFHPSEFVEFLRPGPVPYSHSVGKLTYNYSFNHHHMSKPPKYKSPSPDLLFEFQICVPSCLFYISS